MCRYTCCTRCGTVPLGTKSMFEQVQVKVAVSPLAVDKKEVIFALARTLE